jgi:hypothetical protein
MGLRMITFECNECGHRFEELVNTVEGITKETLPCEFCDNGEASMVMDKPVNLTNVILIKMT